MSKTEYIHKEIPLECLENLPDEACVLGYGEGEVEAQNEGGFIGWAFDRRWHPFGPKPSECFWMGALPQDIYAAPMNSEVAKALRQDRDMPVKEWLKTLPNGYRQRALANLDGDAADTIRPSLSRALLAAFIWEDSPEGSAFWNDLHDSIILYNEIPPYTEPARSHFGRISERQAKSSTEKTDSREIGAKPFLDWSDMVISNVHPSDEGEWIPLSDARPRDFNGDINGKVWVTNGKTTCTMRPAEIDRTWTHWRPTGITSLPKDPAKEAFDKWYVSATGNHRREQEQAFLAGFEKGKELEEYPQ